MDNFFSSHRASVDCLIQEPVFHWTQGLEKTVSGEAGQGKGVGVLFNPSLIADGYLTPMFGGSPDWGEGDWLVCHE